MGKSFEHIISERDGEIVRLNQAIAERDGKITELYNWALELDKQLIQMTASTSWQITLPLREMRCWLDAPKLQAKRYLNMGLRLAKRMYQSLPLSEQTKAAHRNTLAKHFPKPSNLLVDINSRSASENFTGEDDYQNKIQQELVIFEKRTKVHDLPDIYHYWSNKYLAPIFLDAGFKSVADFFSSNLLNAKNRTRSDVANFVSIGAGNCDLEVSVAKNMVDAGFKKFVLECIEINPAMLKRGQAISKENGVLNNLRFVQADFNRWVAKKKYDGVMAHQSLHHVTHLEHLFDQISTGLHANGSFVISDMIGRNGHKRWPESLAIVKKYWQALPESYKFNVVLNRFEKEYDNWDCSSEGFEGIRSQEILPLLIERFQCEKFIGFGSAIDIFVDRCFGHNFNPEREWDQEFIDKVHAEDEVGLRSGKLTPTHMIAVFGKNLNRLPYYSRGITPQHSVRMP